MSTPTAPAPTTVWDEAHLARAAFSHVISGSDGFLRMRLDVDDPAEVWADARFDDEIYTPRIKALALDPSNIPAKAEANGWRFIIPGDSEWPASLDHLGTETPIGLWAAGPAHVADASRSRDAIAYAGPRASATDEDTLAVQIGRTLADNAKTLITGLSLGTQQHALAAALDVGGRTIAVTSGDLLGSSLDQQRSQITSAGVLVSHRPFDLRPTRDDHAQTMRIVVALADALIYNQAPSRSAAHVAFQTAVKLHRRLYVHPGHPTTDALTPLEAAETFTSATDLLDVLDREDAL